MKTIIWDPLAREEYADALAKSSDASAFRGEVDDALANIASGTVSHATIRRTIFRRCILTRRLPYSIIYSETDDEVVVAVFPHHKQKPASWMRRLRRS